MARRCRAAALLAAALSAIGGCAAPPPAARAAGAAALAERLPSTAAGFTRREARPSAAGDGGREVLYATEGGPPTAAATVELAPGDASADAALKAALADALRAGPARRMREAGRFAVAPAGAPVAGQALLCAETAGSYGRERVAGLVCAGRAGAGLVRLRVVMPAGGPPFADARAFAEAIAAALAAGPGRAAG